MGTGSSLNGGQVGTGLGYGLYLRVLTAMRLGGPAMRTVGILLLLALSSTLAQAHPGRTANDGCHYCRTNCSSWGVPKNQRHCHYKAEPQSLDEGLLKVSSPTRGYDEHEEHSHRGAPSHTHSSEKYDSVERHGH